MYRYHTLTSASLATRSAAPPNSGVNSSSGIGVGASGVASEADFKVAVASDTGVRVGGKVGLTASGVAGSSVGDPPNGLHARLASTRMPTDNRTQRIGFIFVLLASSERWAGRSASPLGLPEVPFWMHNGSECGGGWMFAPLTVG